MQEPAPKRIIQSAEQPTQDLHKKISDNLNRLGHSETTASVNPHDQSSLEIIRERLGAITKDPVRIMGGVVEEHIGGETPTTHVGTTAGKEPISILSGRRLLQKAA